jgi:hypothetical protein
VKRESISQGSIVMQVSPKPKTEFRSMITRTAAAFGVVLVIGAFGIGSAHADGYNYGDNNRYGDDRRADRRYDNDRNYRGPVYAEQPDYYYAPQPDYYAAPDPDRYYRPGPSYQVTSPGISLFFGL